MAPWNRLARGLLRTRLLPLEIEIDLVGLGLDLSREWRLQAVGIGWRNAVGFGDRRDRHSRLAFSISRSLRLLIDDLIDDDAKLAGHRTVTRFVGHHLVTPVRLNLAAGRFTGLTHQRDKRNGAASDHRFAVEHHHPPDRIDLDLTRGTAAGQRGD